MCNIQYNEYDSHWRRNNLFNTIMAHWDLNATDRIWWDFISGQLMHLHPIWFTFPERLVGRFRWCGRTSTQFVPVQAPSHDDASASTSITFVIVLWQSVLCISITAVWWDVFSLDYTARCYINEKECRKKLIVRAINGSFISVKDLMHHGDMGYDLSVLKRRISCVVLTCDLKLNARNLVGTGELKWEIWAENYRLQGLDFGQKDYRKNAV
jgi:hypothetical protein